MPLWKICKSNFWETDHVCDGRLHCSPSFCHTPILNLNSCRFFYGSDDRDIFADDNLWYDAECWWVYSAKKQWMLCCLFAIFRHFRVFSSDRFPLNWSRYILKERASISEFQSSITNNKVNQQCDDAGGWIMVLMVMIMMVMSSIWLSNSTSHASCTQSWCNNLKD